MRTSLWNARRFDRTKLILPPVSLALGVALVTLFAMLAASGNASAQPSVTSTRWFPIYTASAFGDQPALFNDDQHQLGKQRPPEWY